MNIFTRHSQVIISILLCLLGTNANAQNGDFLLDNWLVHIGALPQEESKTAVFAAPKPKELPPLRVVRYYKPVPFDYSGIFIELYQGQTPLKAGDQQMNQWGKVYYQQLPNKQYSYGFLTSFKSIKEGEKFLQKAVLHRAQDAKIVLYKAGKRLN